MKEYIWYIYAYYFEYTISDSDKNNLCTQLINCLGASKRTIRKNMASGEFIYAVLAGTL